MPPDNLLMVADSDHDANMLYAVGMFVRDPFIFLRLNGQALIVMSDFEIDRARREAPHCRVLSLSRCQKKLRRAGVKKPDLARVVALLLRDRGLSKVFVPMNFPLGLARQLRDLKVKVKLGKGAFFPERDLKTTVEVKKISAALLMAEVGLSEGIQALKRARAARDGKLLLNGVPFTAEKLRAIIDTAVLQSGGLASHTIVAPGRQACDPHECGHGPLRANQPIILDVFPSSQKTGYFGDITRTVVKGRASEGVRRLYHTVGRAQQLAFDEMTPGAKGAAIHKAVEDFFHAEGYKTGRRQGRMQGFFHGTGHGLGLEIHESPRAGAHSSDILKAGHVITIEPGLYYPALGGVRLEDVALVTPNAPRNLTKFEKVLEV